MQLWLFYNLEYASVLRVKLSFCSRALKVIPNLAAAYRPSLIVSHCPDEHQRLGPFVGSL